MASEWQRTTLDQLGPIVTGKTPPSNRADFFGGDIPFVTPTDFDGRRIIDTTGRYLTESGANSVGVRIPARAVMVSCIGSDMGKAAVAGRNCVTNQQINSIIVTEPNNPLFVYYNLSTRKAEIRGAASGSAQPILNKSAFGKLPILLPPPAEQSAIAHILGTLDDKIELNRRMCETLEAMARALFKAWFVDFEPVRAKCRGARPCAPTGWQWPQQILDLFPDRLVDSELGEIPEGWEVGTLGDVLSEIVSGARPKGGAIDQGIPSIGAENVIGLGRYDFSKEKFVAYEFFQQLRSKGADVRPQDVLLYKDGAQIGRKTFFDRGFPHVECAVNEHVLILRCTNHWMQRYLFFWLDLPWVTSEIVSLNSNSAQPGINQAGVRQLPLLRPTDEVVKAFDQLVSPLTDMLFEQCHQSRTLAALCDALLPKLISGELRVRDAEHFLKGRGING